MTMDTLSMRDTLHLYLALSLPDLHILIDPQAWVMSSNIEPATISTLQTRMAQKCWAQVLRSSKILVEGVSVLMPSKLMLSRPTHSLGVTLTHASGAKRISLYRCGRGRGVVPDLEYILALHVATNHWLAFSFQWYTRWTYGDVN